ncbi:hypothetical protein IV203_037087 [Nitzschia inconspicua]|uniref:Uncharacterized protein n=1 Tax=Nitzschia inconspicua TaxID=303405 RepID=A0A9K3LP09_9STRA|nr:hypothetical protein IV203_037087 [Nitzschia inconspicua]
MFPIIIQHPPSTDVMTTDDTITASKRLKRGPDDVTNESSAFLSSFSSLTNAVSSTTLTFPTCFPKQAEDSFSSSAEREDISDVTEQNDDDDDNNNSTAKETKTITPGSSTIAFPSSSTILSQDSSEFNEKIEHDEEWIPPMYKQSQQIGLSLENVDDEDDEKEIDVIKTNTTKTATTCQTYRPSTSQSMLSLSAIPSIPVVSEQGPIDTNILYSPPTKHTKRPGRFRFILEMILIQVLVLLSFEAYQQTTNKLILPTRQTTAVPSDPVVTHNTSVVVAQYIPTDDEVDDCIYVPGGGFSGFWFTLGRLSALSFEQAQQETFVCYSAGCLGVVATLLQHFQREHDLLLLQQQQQQQQPQPPQHGILDLSSDPSRPSVVSGPGHQELYSMARAIQLEWLDGSLHRYEVVEAFIDRMMDILAVTILSSDEHSGNNTMVESPLYQRFLHTIQNNLFVVTSVPMTSTDTAPESNRRGLLQATLQRPNDLASLKRMLLQTTWIPMAVGSSFSHQGHLDGAFTVWQHPSCRRNVGLVMPKRKQSSNIKATNGGVWAAMKSYSHLLSDAWMLWSNTLNVNLGKHAVENLFQMGLEHGV